jgi:hypothetical protein
MEAIGLTGPGERLHLGEIHDDLGLARHLTDVVGQTDDHLLDLLSSVGQSMGEPESGLSVGHCREGADVEIEPIAEHATANFQHPVEVTHPDQPDRGVCPGGNRETMGGK